MTERVIVAYDSGGASLADLVKKAIIANGFAVCQISGCGERDYPELALDACHLLLETAAHSAILMCGTGVGMSIAANKVNGIRAARCTDPYATERARRSNDANVLAFGGEVVGPSLAAMLVKTWLDNNFDSETSIRKVNAVAEIEETHGMAADRG